MRTHEFILAQVTPSTGPTQTETQVAQTPKASKPDAISGIWTMLMPFLLIVGLYVLFMRPQYKKEKQLQESLKKLTKGDKVITRGGIWGTIVGIKDAENIVVVKIADDVKVEVTKSAIETINPQLKAEAKSAEKKSDKKK